MVGRAWRCVAGLVLAGVCGIASAQIILYERENFGGRTFGAGGTVPNLDDTGFNDRASSVVVRGGRWQLCDDAQFRGRCVTLEGGEYPSLRAMGLDHKVSSIRELGWSDDRRGDPYGGGRVERRPSGPRAILYSGENLSGRAFAIEAPGLGDLDRTGFNDRARSLRIEGGDWVFCSDSDFRGNCRTYGPGDYPSLPSGQSGVISSARLLSGNERGDGGDPRRDRRPEISRTRDGFVVRVGGCEVVYAPRGGREGVSPNCEEWQVREADRAMGGYRGE